MPIHSFAFRTTLIQENKFDERLDYIEDWDFMIRIANNPHFKALFISEEICEYRKPLDGSNLVSIENNQNHYKIAREIVTQKIWELQNLNISGFDIKEFSDYFYTIFAKANEFERFSHSKIFKLWNKMHRNDLMRFIFKLVNKISCLFNLKN